MTEFISMPEPEEGVFRPDGGPLVIAGYADTAFLRQPAPDPILSISCQETPYTVSFHGRDGRMAVGIRDGKLVLDAEVEPPELAARFVACVDALLADRGLREANYRRIFEGNQPHGRVP